MRIYAKHAPGRDGHLVRVMEEMLDLGPPVIRCVSFCGRTVALEGSHRLAAAHLLGMPVNLVLLPLDLPEPGPEDALSNLDGWHLDRLDAGPYYELRCAAWGFVTPTFDEDAILRMMQAS